MSAFLRLPLLQTVLVAACARVVTGADPAHGVELRRSAAASGTAAVGASLRLQSTIGQPASGSASLPPTFALESGVLGGASAAGSGCVLASRFDTDLEGWTVTGDNVTFWNPTDGNPDGCLEIVDDATGAWGRAIAPIEWLGNWSAFTAADSLIYEAIHIPGAGASGSNPPYVFRIEGPGGGAQWDPPSLPANSWNRFAAPLDSTQWNVTSGTWTDLLQNVGQLLVAAEMITGAETVRIDNICLTNTPSGEFYQECELATFELGYPGWTSVDANLARITTAGDTGHYVRVTQTDPAGKLIAPPWWYGDWSALDGDGTISFSLTFLSDVIEPGREVRLEMSGPGGSAIASASTDNYVLPNRTWHVFSWPIDSGSWTLSSGTWAGLLSDVTELSVSCDYEIGNDVFGIDSFARGASSCDPPASPLVFYEPGYSECAALHFRQASALAIHPLNGFLYTAVDLTLGGKGGIYVLTGPLAGSRIASMPTPKGLLFTADGDGFATDNSAGNLYRFVGTDSVMIWGSEFHAGDDDPAGMVVAPPGFNGPNVAPGNLLIADHGGGGPDEIWVASADSANVERLLVPDPGSVDWYDLATDGTTVWACDGSDDDLLWTIHPDGTTSQLALSANITNKRAFVYDSGEEYLYTLKTTNPLGLWRIDPWTGQVTLIAEGFGGFGYSNLEIDPVARKLWISDEVDSRVYEICLPAASPVHAGHINVVPTVLALSLRPNPVVSGTRIQLDLPHDSRVKVDIINAAGRRVRTFDRGVLPAGSRSLLWDGRDGLGHRVAAGVYFVRLRSDNETRTRKAVVFR